MHGVLLGLLGWAVLAGHSADAPRDRYEALVKEYEASAAAGDRTEPQAMAARFFALAEEAPNDPVAIDALVWVASRCVFGAESTKALGILERDHSASPRLKDFCGQCSRYGEPFAPYEALLRAVLKNSPDREVRGRACVALASYLKMARDTSASYLVRIKIENERSIASDSRLNFQRVLDRGLDAVAAESEALFEKVIAEYPDLRLETELPSKATEFAQGQLFELRNLAIGQKAPEIEGNDIHGKPMKLSDHRGQVVVLDFGSHRSCGVCRQMYPGLRSLNAKFAGKPFALLGVSVDDDPRQLVQLTKQGEITWPMWFDGEDGEGPIATRWVIRAMPTFYVLDAQGIIRNKGFLQPSQVAGTVEMLLREMSEPRH